MLFNSPALPISSGRCLAAHAHTGQLPHAGDVSAMSAHGGREASLPVPASDSEEFDRDSDVFVGKCVMRQRVNPSML